MTRNLLVSLLGWIAPCAIVAQPSAIRIGPSPAAYVEGSYFESPLDGWAFGEHIFRTVDGGASWSRVGRPPGRAIVSRLAIAAGRAYCLSNGALYSSSRSRIAWVRLRTPLDPPKGQLTGVHAAGDRVVVSGGVYRRVPRGHDGPANAISVRGEQWFELAARVLAFNPRELLWEDRSDGLEGNRTTGIVATPDDSMLALVDEDVFRYEPSTRRWRRGTRGNRCPDVQEDRPGALRANELPSVVALSAPASAVLLLSTRNGRLFRSRDDGESWCPVTHSGQGNKGWLADIDMVSESEGTALGSPPGVLLFTLDGGRSWRTKVTEGLVRSVSHTGPGTAVVITERDVLSLEWQRRAGEPAPEPK